MFVSGWDGSLYRYSGLSQVYAQDDVEDNLTRELLETFPSACTGIACDPNDANHVVITLGGYGNISSGKVRETWNALDANPTWTNIWNNG